MEPRPAALPTTSEALAERLSAVGYLTSPELSLTLWLALALERPLLVEGPAGVGKTELARAAAQALGRRLVRLQCYEGLDEGKALYEWDYAKQMLHVQLLRSAVAEELAGAATLAEAEARVARSEATFYDERFLLARPLLEAVRSEEPVVLLVDEVDRAEPELEALLLEVLADLAITIPELGRTFAARSAPLVVLTTNGTREMTEALRRRCLHLFVDYPSPALELAIVRARVPDLEVRLAAHVSAFVAELRRVGEQLDLRKLPAVSETLDWARAVLVLGRSALDAALVAETLGVLLKHVGDREAVRPKLEALLAASEKAAAALTGSPRPTP